MKYVIYTCITGNYDNLLQPLIIDNDFDYICFSNDICESRVGVWEIRKIPYSCHSNILLTRYVKLLPHYVLQQYDYSLWIDGNLQITGNEIYEIFKAHVQKGSITSHVNHAIPFCDCIYDEITACMKYNMTNAISAAAYYLRMEKKDYPHHNGLYENNIIFRKHNDMQVIRNNEDWWHEFITYRTMRDQFSLCYVYWKNQFVPDVLMEQQFCSRNVSYLKKRMHNMTPPKSFMQRIVHWMNGYVCLLFLNIYVKRKYGTYFCYE